MASGDEFLSGRVDSSCGPRVRKNGQEVDLLLSRNALRSEDASPIVQFCVGLERSAALSHAAFDWLRCKTVSENLERVSVGLFIDRD
jgi:hypothetical protein